MARIRFDDRIDPAAALATARDTFLSRGYHWEPGDALTAVASEGGAPSGAPKQLVVKVDVDPERRQIRLAQRTATAAAVAGAGAPFFLVRQNFRFASVAKAVRKDLEAAGR